MSNRTLQRGEIVTLVTLLTVGIVSLSSLIVGKIAQNSPTINTRAAVFCNDPDRDAQPYSVKTAVEDNNGKYMDECINKNELREYSCSNNVGVSERVWCDKGCVSGACSLTQVTPTPKVQTSPPAGSPTPGQTLGGRSFEVRSWSCNRQTQELEVEYYTCQKVNDKLEMNMYGLPISRDQIKTRERFAVDPSCITGTMKGPLSTTVWHSNIVSVDYSFNKYIPDSGKINLSLDRNRCLGDVISPSPSVTTVPNVTATPRPQADTPTPGGGGEIPSCTYYAHSSIRLNSADGPLAADLGFSTHTVIKEKNGTTQREADIAHPSGQYTVNGPMYSLDKQKCDQGNCRSADVALMNPKNLNIMGTFCNNTGNGGLATNCNKTSSQLGSNANVMWGFNIVCGAHYDYGWIVKNDSPTPSASLRASPSPQASPTPNIDSSLPTITDLAVKEQTMGERGEIPKCGVLKMYWKTPPPSSLSIDGWEMQFFNSRGLQTTRFIPLGATCYGCDNGAGKEKWQAEVPDVNLNSGEKCVFMAPGDYSDTDPGAKVTLKAVKGLSKGKETTSNNFYASSIHRTYPGGSCQEQCGDFDNRAVCKSQNGTCTGLANCPDNQQFTGYCGRDGTTDYGACCIVATPTPTTIPQPNPSISQTPFNGIIQGKVTIDGIVPKDRYIQLSILEQSTGKVIDLSLFSSSGEYVFDNLKAEDYRILFNAYYRNKSGENTNEAIIGQFDAIDCKRGGISYKDVCYIQPSLSVPVTNQDFIVKLNVANLSTIEGTVIVNGNIPNGYKPHMYIFNKNKEGLINYIGYNKDLDGAHPYKYSASVLPGETGIQIGFNPPLPADKYSISYYPQQKCNNKRDNNQDSVCYINSPGRLEWSILIEEKNAEQAKFNLVIRTHDVYLKDGRKPTGLFVVLSHEEDGRDIKDIDTLVESNPQPNTTYTYTSKSLDPNKIYDVWADFCHDNGSGTERSCGLLSGFYHTVTGQDCQYGPPGSKYSQDWYCRPKNQTITIDINKIEATGFSFDSTEFASADINGDGNVSIASDYLALKRECKEQSRKKDCGKIASLIIKYKGQTLPKKLFPTLLPEMNLPKE